MRMLHVINSLDPARGGPQAVVADLSAAQAALGHQVAVAAYAAPSATVAPPAVDLRLAAAGGLFERLAAPRMARLLERMVPASEVVHLHGIWEPELLRAAAIARKVGIAYVVQPHGMLDPWSLAQGAWKKGIALRLAHRRMLDGAALIVALNADEARLLAPLDLAPGIAVVANGVATDAVAALAVPGRFRAAHPELGSDPYVLFLGRLHYKKGLDILAEAFRRLAGPRGDLRLVVVGPEGGAGDALRRDVAAAGLTRRLHLTGPLYGAQKFEALADAAAFCLPSRQEGFSMAITEALACGVPVAISEACHFPEVGEAGAGHVLPLRPEAFAVAIDAILTNPAAAAGMGRAGRALVTERFTWPRIAEESVRIYEDARVARVTAAMAAE